MVAVTPDDAPCPCGTGVALGGCCGRFLASRGGAAAPTAERLMRSRYTAFAVGDLDHLHATWHPSTRPAALKDDPSTTWTGLQVTGTTGGGLFDREGTVAFRAAFRTAGVDDVLVEDSRFVKEDGRWWYVAPV